MFNINRNKLVRWLRLGVLTTILAVVTYETYQHQVLGGGKAPSVHALCPFGGLESFYQVFSTGTFISKIFSGTMILFGITVVLALLFKRSFCGLLCPFGAVQEFSGKVGKKLFRHQFLVPNKIDKTLRYVKYLVLILTVFYAWKTAGLWMNPYDPWAAFSHLSQGFTSVWSDYKVGLIILAATIIGSIVLDRSFCKYLCPMGALYAIIGKLSPFTVRRNDKLCLDCGKCNKVCPVNIDVQRSLQVKSAECLSCQTCVLSCPQAGALETKAGRLTFKPILALILVIGLFFGSIVSFQVAGVFNILPAKLSEGQSIGLADVKGYMTIKEAAEGTKIEIKEFYEKYKIPENVPSDTQMKNISKVVPEYDFNKVKESNGGTE